MATFQKYPVYTYDEPATYDNFRGGINLDPSSENLADNELMDCVNMEYSHVTLQKRKGAKRLCRLLCKNSLNFIQGITIFTKENSFIVVAADGMLYYSLYMEGVDLELERLPIYDFDYNLVSDKKTLDLLNQQHIDPNRVSLRSLSQFADLPVYNYLRVGDLLSNGYVLDLNPTKNGVDPKPELIFQTKSKVEFASYNNKLYVATGTRLVNLFVDETSGTTLYAMCVAPYVPNGIEYQLYGENFMSPYPYECLRSGEGAAAAIKNLITFPSKARIPAPDSDPNNERIKGSDVIQCVPTMVYPSGKGPRDYYYKWEAFDFDSVTGTFRWRTLSEFTKEDTDNYDNIVIVRKEISEFPRYPLYFEDKEKAPEGKAAEEQISPDQDKKEYKIPTSQEIQEMVDGIKNEDGTIKYEPPYSDIMVITNNKKDYFYYDDKSKEWKNQGPYVDYRSDESKYNPNNNMFYIHTETKTYGEDTHFDADTIDGVKIRCSFASNLEEKKDENGKIHYVPAKLDGSTFGQFQTTISTAQLNSTSSTWRIVQTCKKILSDGNKFILYDDAYNSGLWFKTIINKPGYTTNRGSLSFKTTKNEQVIKVVHFKGVLVVFSYAHLIGGNISIVTGNGDDDPMEQGYSPYIRKVVNSEITCDSPNTVQIAENLLFFKFRDTVYAIEGSSISSEIITLYSMNDRLKHKNRKVTIPWDEECVSEITEDYYGLIWKEKIGYENGEAFVSRPAMRLKMYYKIGQEIDRKIFFPWLRDESPVFNSDAVIYIEGKATHLRDMELLQYNNDEYLDIDQSYECEIKLKAYDLNYPKMSKFIRNVLLYYSRETSKKIDIDLSIENESGHEIIDKTCAKDSLQDEQTIEGWNSEGKLGQPYTNTKVYNSKYMFPLLQAVTNIKVKCDDAFTINSITFNYYTTDTPTNNPYDSYVKIIKRSTPISRNKIKLNALNGSDKAEEKEYCSPYLQSLIEQTPNGSPVKTIILKAGTINDRALINKPIVVINSDNHFIKKSKPKEKDLTIYELKVNPTDMDDRLNKTAYQEIVNCNKTKTKVLFVIRGGTPSIKNDTDRR